MITITNGVNVIEVTNGAYSGIFAKQGYYPVESANKPAQPATEPEKAKSEVLIIEQIEEKPISQWSGKEIKAYADAKGIEIPSGLKVPEQREFVKNEIEAAEIEAAEADDDDWDDEE